MCNRDNACDVAACSDEQSTKRSEPNKPYINQDKHHERSSNLCYTLNPWEHMPNSKYFPATTNRRSWYLQGFFVKPVLKIS